MVTENEVNELLTKYAPKRFLDITEIESEFELISFVSDDGIVDEKENIVIEQENMIEENNIIPTNEIVVNEIIEELIAEKITIEKEIIETIIIEPVEELLKGYY